MQIQRNTSHTVLPKKTAYQWFIEALANHSGDGCLLWPYAKTNAGYGSFRLHMKNMSVHIASYELAYGPVPEGLWVLHTCDTPPCFNPRHLLSGTCKDNELDKHSKNRGAYGIEHGGHVLSESQVLHIRKLHADGLSSYAISQMSEFGVSKPTILSIVNRRTWNRLA